MRKLLRFGLMSLMLVVSSCGIDLGGQQRADEIKGGGLFVEFVGDSGTSAEAEVHMHERDVELFNLPTLEDSWREGYVVVNRGLIRDGDGYLVVSAMVDTTERCFEFDVFLTRLDNGVEVLLVPAGVCIPKSGNGQAPAIEGLFSKP